jgi:uncharacterized membrane protein YeaQ/YmgE (transglycosylase-associated protein family)
MSIIAWLMLGMVAGVVANQLSAKRGVGLVSDAVIGVAGAAVAGFAYKMLAGREGFGVTSLLVSLLGAGVFLGVFRAMTGPARAAAAEPVRRHRGRRD